MLSLKDARILKQEKSSVSAGIFPVTLSDEENIPLEAPDIFSSTVGQQIREEGRASPTKGHVENYSKQHSTRSRILQIIWRTYLNRKLSEAPSSLRLLPLFQERRAHRGPERRGQIKRLSRVLSARFGGNRQHFRSARIDA